MPDSAVCPACGARNAPGTARCDLCGEPLTPEAAAQDEPTPPAAASPAAGEAEAAPAEPPAEAPVERQFCMACGAASPAHARFCWRCGAALYTASAEGAPDAPRPAAALPPDSAAAPAAAAPAAHPPPPAEGGRPPSPEGKRALLLVGVAVLAVVVLFFATQWSGDGEREAAPTAAAPTAAAPEADVLPAEVAAEVAALEDQIAAAAPEERVRLQRDLVGLLARSGAFTRAGELQEALAREEDTALAWADAGSFFLAAMLRTEGPARADLAQRSARAYERSLELEPDDLDVKTDLATAYLNDPAQPMQAVQLVQEVLEADPDHVRARFNYGLMLAQISRLDQAQEQFERVIALTEPGDIVRDRAEQELARIEAALAGASAG